MKLSASSLSLAALRVLAAAAPSRAAVSSMGTSVGVGVELGAPTHITVKLTTGFGARFYF